MTCRETKNLLNAYVDGELDFAGSLAVETHMRGCASCLADGENLHGLAAAIENASLFQSSCALEKGCASGNSCGECNLIHWTRSGMTYWLISESNLQN